MYCEALVLFLFQVTCQGILNPPTIPTEPPTDLLDQINQLLSTSINPSFTTPPLLPSNILLPDVTSTPVIALECLFDMDPLWGIPWPPSPIGETVLLPCPPGFQGAISRICLPMQKWGIPNIKNCVGNGFSDDFNNEAKSFFKGSPDASGSIFLINQLKNFSKPGDDNSKAPFLSKTELSTINFVAGQALDVLLQDGGEGNQVEDIVDLLNNALDSRNKDSWLQLQESESGSEELLSNAEMYAEYLGRTLNSSTLTAKFSRENLALRANRFSADDIITDSVFPLESDLINSTLIDQNSIKIPSAYLQSLANENNSDVTVVNMLFTTLQDLLPDSETGENQTLAAIILSSQIFTDSDDFDINEDVLQDNPIELVFTINETYSLANESIIFQCVYWDFTDDFNSTSFGSWVSDGIVAEIIDNSTVRCLSNHLTSFSVLVDVVYDGGDDNDTNATEITPDVEQQLLSIVSYIGCTVSIVCLTLTVIWLLSLGKSLFSEVHNFIHLGLALSLLLSLIMFIGGIQFSSSVKPLCIIFTALLHYLFLSTFCWMLCEGLMLFIMLVIVFSTLIKKWWLYCIIGWGVPIIPVAITLGIDFNNYTADEICWLNNSNHLIWGFVGPMILIIAINFVVLIIVLVKIFQIKKATKKTSGSKGEARDIASHLIKGALVLLPLLGLTWIIGIFAVDLNTTVFAWLFTVLNSLQGAFIFFFHVLRSKKFMNKVNYYYRRRKKNIEAESQLTQQTKQNSSFLSSKIVTMSTVPEAATVL